MTLRIEQWPRTDIPRGRRNVLAVSIQTQLFTKWPGVRESALSVIAAYFGLPVRLSQLTLEYLKKHPKRQTQVQSNTILKQLASAEIVCFGGKTKIPHDLLQLPRSFIHMKIAGEANLCCALRT